MVLLLLVGYVLELVQMMAACVLQVILVVAVQRLVLLLRAIGSLVVGGAIAVTHGYRLMVNQSDWIVCVLIA